MSDLDPSEFQGVGPEVFIPLEKPLEKDEITVATQKHEQVIANLDEAEDPDVLVREFRGTGPEGGGITQLPAITQLLPLEPSFEVENTFQLMIFELIGIYHRKRSQKALR